MLLQLRMHRPRQTVPDRLPQVRPTFRDFAHSRNNRAHILIMFKINRSAISAN